MKALLDQIEQSLNSSYYYLSLMASLTIPDIAGALNSVDGLATGQNYKEWFEEYVRPQYAETIRESLPPNFPIDQTNTMENPLTGDACYKFRCSLLHQGSTHHPRSEYDRIIFVEPNSTTNTIHYCILNNALCIDVRLFCKEVIRGTLIWLDVAEGTEPFMNNNRNLIRRYPVGLTPYIQGVPVIG